jgi:ABC-type enterobactin transport system permease subunit
VLSLAVGSKPIPLADVLAALTAFDDTVENHLIVQSLRLPARSWR